MTSVKHIIFCGTPEFAVPSLEALINDDAFSVDLVITQPDKPVGRKQVLTPPPVKVCAKQHGIPVAQPEKLNDMWQSLDVPQPDFVVVVAYGQLVSKDVLAWPKIAPINVHGSLLPKLRGASPIQHTILSDESAAGITLQRMVSKLDAGPILAQQSVSIDPRETTETLHHKLMQMSADLLPKTLKHPLTETKQEESAATFCKKLSRADGMVDPQTMTAEEIDRRVRALTPWPGVTWNDKKILQTELSETPDSYALPCKDNTMLYITMIQPAGKKPMTGAAWNHGNNE